MVDSLGSEEKRYTYTIVTTDSNKQLNFLHDRMPVVLENGSDQIRTWLDPKRSEWSNELQSLLRPYNGELECYVVSKDVGKVGNNSPDFIVPVSSSKNKSNIANFFTNANKSGKTVKDNQPETKTNTKEDRPTIDQPRSEDNAPVPAPPTSTSPKGNKRPRQEDSNSHSLPTKSARVEDPGHNDPKENSSKPIRGTQTIQEKRKTRSATSNDTALKKSPLKTADGSQKITEFFS